MNPDKPRRVIQIPDPEPIQTREIKWVVLTRDTIPENGQFVYFALDPSDYENLSLTQADILRWVKEVKWRLEYYRDAATAEPKEKRDE